MKPLARRGLFGVLLALLLTVDSSAQPSAPNDDSAKEARQLVGLWKARQWFGPYARGTLILEKSASGWTADFVGRTTAAEASGNELRFDLPAEQGSFRGHLLPDRKSIVGQWISPRSPIHGSRYASPVVLTSDGSERWRGEVTPRDDTFTLYLKVEQRPDGTLGAFLRNPERNIGVFIDVSRLSRQGNTVQLLGQRRGEKTERVLLEGTYDAESEILSIALPSRGGTYDFRRDDEHSEFYARGAHPDRYSYRPPPQLNDGWPTSTLEQARIDRGAVEKFVQTIVELPIDSVHALEVHGVLIARDGKLVLEEYFHGEHRDKLHDTRSAAKSLTSTVIGAAMHARAPVQLTTPVYSAMNGGKFPPELDPKKRTMTLEHLLMMRSGYFCDDTNPAAPGNEDAMLDQSDEPDYYRYTLRLPLDREPGAKGVYCSIDPNLALGVLSRASGERALDTYDRLVGTALEIPAYSWPLSPAGDPYGGGGVWMRPRDFMKLGQLMIGGGEWHGRRVLDADYAQRASGPLHDLRGIQYGYLWWSIEYPYKERRVRAYFAGGNGGQLVMAIPELDLVIAAYGGNYSDRVSLRIQQEFVPNYILPAVRESGANPNAPIAQPNFSTPYGRPPGQ